MRKMGISAEAEKRRRRRELLALFVMAPKSKQTNTRVLGLRKYAHRLIAFKVGDGTKM